MTAPETAPDQPAGLLGMAALMLTGLTAVVAGMLAVGALTDGRNPAAAIQAGVALVLAACATFTWRRGSAGWLTVAGLAVVVLWAAALGVVLIAVVAFGLGAALVISFVSRSVGEPR